MHYPYRAVCNIVIPLMPFLLSADALTAGIRTVAPIQPMKIHFQNQKFADLEHKTAQEQARNSRINAEFINCIICTIEGKYNCFGSFSGIQVLGIPTPTKTSFVSTGIAPASLKEISFLLTSI